MMRVLRLIAVYLVLALPAATTLLFSRAKRMSAAISVAGNCCCAAE